MGKKSPSVPTPPDPVATAQAQGQANKEALDESAKLNAVNLYGPSGSTTYGFNPDGTPHSQYTQLTPQGQWLYDAQQAIAGQLSQKAYQGIQSIPNDPFSLQNMPYNPASYNTSAYSTFSPVSYPVNMGQADTSFPQPNGGAASFFPSPPSQGPQGGQGGQDFYAQAMQALAGKGSAQQPPPAAGGTPGSTTTPGSSAYQPSPGQTGGQTVPINNQWFPDSSVYTTPAGPPGTTATQPQMPGASGAPAGGAPAPGGNPTPGATNATPAAWKYGDALTPAMMSHNGQSVTGYGLGLAQQLAGDRYGGDMAKFMSRNPGVTGSSAQDLLYAQRPAANTPAGAMSGKGGANPAMTGLQDSNALNTYRLDHMGNPVPATPAASTTQGAATGPNTHMPTMPGQSPAPSGAAPGGAPQYQGNPANQQFIQQAMQSLGGKGGASSPPAPGSSASGGAITPLPQTNGQPGQPGANGSIPAAYPSGNLNGLPYDPRSYGNLDMYDKDVQNAVFDQQMSNLKPVIDQQYDRQYQMLADRGLPVGGDAWNKAISQLNRDSGNQYQQAANQAIAAGGAEASRKMGAEQGLRSTSWTEALGAHQTQNSDMQQRMQIEQNLRNQAIQEYNMQRTGSFNEAAAFLQGAPALQMPNAPSMPQYNMQAPDVIGATMGAYGAQMQAYNAQAAQAGSAWQGAAGMVGGLSSLAAKCSRTYKEDDAPAERILDVLKTLPIRTWRYKPDIDPRQEMHIGPYAEDWKRLFGLGDGKEINYMDALGVLMKSMQELTDDLAHLRAKVERDNVPATKTVRKKKKVAK